MGAEGTLQPGVGDAVSSLEGNDVTCQKEEAAVLVSTVLSSASPVRVGRLEKEMGGAGKETERQYWDAADLGDQEDGRCTVDKWATHVEYLRMAVRDHNLRPTRLGGM